jgi:CheY-like chemotaxis protein
VNRHVLVVEDDADIRESVRELLESEGLTVSVAANGREALAHLNEAETLPDLVLLDLMMPVMDGFAFRERQRADTRLAGIPVVVLSANPKLDARHDLLDARAYLTKPCDIDLLLATVSGTG